MAHFPFLNRTGSFKMGSGPIQKFIFYKMVHDQKYHVLISCKCCAESSGCKTGHPSYNHKTCSAVTKQEGPILKWAGLQNGSVQIYFPNLSVGYFIVGL